MLSHDGLAFCSLCFTWLFVCPGLVFSEDEVWQEHRRFTLGCLRDLGMGREGLENIIQAELDFFLEDIAQHKGEPFPSHQHLAKAISNIICCIIYGSRFDYSDPDFLANLENLERSTRRQTMVGMVNFMPYLAFMLRFSSAHKQMVGYQRSRVEYAQRQIDSHTQSRQQGDTPRDFIDKYLSRAEDMRKQGQHTTFSSRLTGWLNVKENSSLVGIKGLRQCVNFYAIEFEIFFHNHILIVFYSFS